MHTYVMFLRHTDQEPRSTVHGFRHPAQDARSAIEQSGGEMLQFHWGTGDDDQFLLYSMPSVEAAAEFTSAVLATGRFSSQRSYRLQDPEA